MFEIISYTTFPITYWLKVLPNNYKAKESNATQLCLKIIYNISYIKYANPQIVKRSF